MPPMVNRAQPPRSTGQVTANPDDVDRAPRMAKEASIEPSSPKAAAWMSFIQSLYASAEFRFRYR